MAGNHFKGSDNGRPAVPPRPNGAGKAGTPGGAGQGWYFFMKSLNNAPCLI